MSFFSEKVCKSWLKRAVFAVLIHLSVFSLPEYHDIWNQTHRPPLATVPHRQAGRKCFCPIFAPLQCWVGVLDARVSKSSKLNCPTAYFTAHLRNNKAGHSSCFILYIGCSTITFVYNWNSSITMNFCNPHISSFLLATAIRSAALSFSERDLPTEIGAAQDIMVNECIYWRLPGNLSYTCYLILRLLLKQATNPVLKGINFDHTSFYMANENVSCEVAIVSLIMWGWLRERVTDWLPMLIT